MPVQAAIGAAIAVLSAGGALPEAQRAAEAAALAADAASVQNMPEALDEFGRDLNVEKRRQVHVTRAQRCVQRPPEVPDLSFTWSYDWLTLRLRLRSGSQSGGRRQRRRRGQLAAFQRRTRRRCPATKGSEAKFWRCAATMSGMHVWCR